MKKIKSKNLVVTMCSGALILASVLLCSYSKKENPQISDNYTDNYPEMGDVGLNYKNVKMRKNGDTFVLSATVNEEATIKSVRFASDRPDCVSVTRKTENSATLTRLKQFTGIVKITAVSDDPFVDFKETCDVRCYNEFESFNDTYSGFLINNSIDKWFDEDEVILAENKTTRVLINITTAFGESDDVYNDGTYTNIEEYDMNIIKEEVTRMFAPNKIENFVQKDNPYSSSNRVTFDVFYKTDLFNGQSSVTKSISLDEKKCTLLLKKYIPVSGLDFTTDSTIVL